MVQVIMELVRNRRFARTDGDSKQNSLGCQGNGVPPKSIKTNSFLTSIRMVYFPQLLNYEKMRAKNLQQSTFTILSTSDLSLGKTRQITHVLSSPFGFEQKLFLHIPLMGWLG